MPRSEKQEEIRQDVQAERRASLTEPERRAIEERARAAEEREGLRPGAASLLGLDEDRDCKWGCLEGDRSKCHLPECQP